jgi:hypothetical protein
MKTQRQKMKAAGVAYQQSVSRKKERPVIERNSENSIERREEEENIHGGAEIMKAINKAAKASMQRKLCAENMAAGENRRKWQRKKMATMA